MQIEEFRKLNYEVKDSIEKFASLTSKLLVDGAITNYEALDMYKAIGVMTVARTFLANSYGEENN